MHSASYRSAFGLCALVLAAAGSANLVANGDFESGFVSFTSGYSYAPGGNSTEGEFTVRSDPQNWNGAFFAMPDHTSGTGKMLVVNGATQSTPDVWVQTISVTSGQSYDFSAYVSTAVSGGPADLVLFVDGVQVGGSTVAPADPGAWLGFSHAFTATGSTAVLRIVDLNSNRFPNDFYLDDISVEAVPEPASLAVLGLGLAAMRRCRKPR